MWIWLGSGVNSLEPPVSHTWKLEVFHKFHSSVVPLKNATDGWHIHGSARHSMHLVIIHLANTEDLTNLIFYASHLNCITTNVVYMLNETKVHQLNLMLSGGTSSIPNDSLHQNDSVVRLLFVQQIALIIKVRWEGLYYCIPCPVNLCWVSCDCGPFSSRNKQCANMT